MVLIIALIIILILIAFIGVIAYSLIHSVNRTLNSYGVQSIFEEIGKGKQEMMTHKKQVKGIGSLLVPKIVKDFPNFSESELYSKVESSLTAIFNSLENKEISSNSELSLIKEKIEEQINDLNDNNINIYYDDVKFHKHSLISYENKVGVCCITVSSSLEYYYKKEKNNKVIDDNDGYKKQALYTTKFIYIIKPEEYDKNKRHILIKCPNCGASLKDLKTQICPYCRTQLNDLNLKAWYLSSYEEDKN